MSVKRSVFSRHLDTLPLNPEKVPLRQHRNPFKDLKAIGMIPKMRNFLILWKFALRSNRWLSAALLDEGCGLTPGELLARLDEAGIEGRHVWKPMNLQPVFADCPFVSVGDAPVCDDLFRRGVCLPSDTKMSMDDADRVCRVIRGIF